MCRDLLISQHTLRSSNPIIVKLEACAGPLACVFGACRLSAEHGVTLYALRGCPFVSVEGLVKGVIEICMSHAISTKTVRGSEETGKAMLNGRIAA
ncbi:hypothetical protein BgiBS90_011695 [Biomphalaria glabrata]|nr:hypothetical protein BgiBS90_011695 [Biomphalaria glabrata]